MGLFGGGTKTLTSTTKTQQPDYIEDPVKRIMRDSERLVEQKPYNAYQGTRIASAGIDSLAARNQVRQLAAYSGQSFNQAGEIFGNIKDINYNPAAASQDVQAGNLPETDLSGYINPFTEQVGQIGEREMLRGIDALRSQTTAQAAGANAFGGSRHGVVDAENERNTILGLQDHWQKVNQGAFGNAQQFATQDLNRQSQVDMGNQGQTNTTNRFNAQNDLSGQQANAQTQLSVGNSMANLGVAGLQTGLSGANALMGMGQWDQAQRQAALDQDYSDFKQQDEFGRGNLEWLMSMAQGAPKTIQQTSTQQVPTAGGGQQLLGAGITAAATMY